MHGERKFTCVPLEKNKNKNSSYFPRKRSIFVVVFFSVKVFVGVNIYCLILCISLPCGKCGCILPMFALLDKKKFAITNTKRKQKKNHI